VGQFEIASRLSPLQPGHIVDAHAAVPVLSLSPAAHDSPADSSRAAASQPVRAVQRRPPGASGSLEMGATLGVVLRPDPDAHHPARDPPRGPRARRHRVPGDPQAPGPGLLRLLSPVPGGSDTGLPPVQAMATLRLCAMGGHQRMAPRPRQPTTAPTRDRSGQASSPPRYCGHPQGHHCGPRRTAMVGDGALCRCPSEALGTHRPGGRHRPRRVRPGGHQ
jgi:hypothetical protein